MTETIVAEVRVRTVDVIPEDRWRVKRCPVCKNRKRFLVYAEPVSASRCLIWASCQCEYDPTFDRRSERLEADGQRVEDQYVEVALATWIRLVDHDERNGRPPTMRGKPFVVNVES